MLHPRNVHLNCCLPQVHAVWIIHSSLGCLGLQHVAVGVEGICSLADAVVLPLQRLSQSMQMCLGVWARAKMSNQQLVGFEMFHDINTVAPRHQVQIGRGQLGGREGGGFRDESARGITGGQVSRAIVLELVGHMMLGVSQRLMGFERDASNGEGPRKIQHMQEVWGHWPHGAKEMRELIPVDFVGRGHQSRRVKHVPFTHGMHMNRDVQGGEISSSGRMIQVDVGQQDGSQIFHRPTQTPEPIMQGGKCGRRSRIDQDRAFLGRDHPCGDGFWPVQPVQVDEGNDRSHGV